MKRTFYRSCRKRIPRKLKKAAKYGVEHYTISPCLATIVKKNGTTFLKCQESNVWITKGRRTKWKVKVCYACLKEYNMMLQEMHRKNIKKIAMHPPIRNNKSRA